MDFKKKMKYVYITEDDAVLREQGLTGLNSFLEAEDLVVEHELPDDNYIQVIRQMDKVNPTWLT